MFHHKMVTYKQLGYVNRLLKLHRKATDCFKKYLQLAWLNEDMGAEMEAYENLSVDYFYLGAMQKANYYDDKFKYGEFEPKDAVVRKVAVGIIKNQIENDKQGRVKD